MSFCTLTLLILATPFEDGSAALLKGDWQGAVDAFTASIDAEPTVKAYVNRGIAYGRLGKLKESFDDYNTAIKIDPHEPVAFYNRGRLFEKANLPDKAIADYTRAITLKPDAVTYSARGAVHHKAKDYGKARDDYRASLELNPNQLSALNKLAWLESTCPDAAYRDGKSAVERATKTCELTKWQVKPYVSTLAAAFAENGEWDKAIRVAQSDETRKQFERREPVRE